MHSAISFDITVKTCKHCNVEKSEEDFDRSPDGRGGRAARCKDCRRAYNRAAYQRTRDGAPGLRPPPAVPGTSKACRDCGQVQPPEAFPRFARSKDGRGTYCKPCHNARGSASRQAHHGSAKNYHLKHRYGITVDDYERMLAEQGGLCALCKERPAEHVDHDHLTGRVRGLLCFCCNQGLGNFRDRADVLRLGVAYLQATTWQKERLEPGVYALHPPLHPPRPRPSVPSGDLGPTSVG